MDELCGSGDGESTGRVKMQKRKRDGGEHGERSVKTVEAKGKMRGRGGGRGSGGRG